MFRDRKVTKALTAARKGGILIAYNEKNTGVAFKGLSLSVAVSPDAGKY
ncbi:MAG: hypothetical protein AAGI14_00450 [Pseudomonadota bacterium]